MDRKGQFIVIGAIVIVAFMFALILAISQMSVQRLVLSPEPVDEVVLAVSSDFERCLQRAFSKASQECLQSYLANGSLKGDKALQLLENEVRRWLVAVLSAYSGYGMNLSLTTERESGSCIDLLLEWSEGRGTSHVYTTFGLDVASYGLEGVALMKSITASLEILEAKMTFAGDRGKITMKFAIEERTSGGERATPSVKEIKVSTSPSPSLVDERSIKLDYLGQGVYLVEFNITGFAVREVRLAITTDKGVVVAAKKGLCVIELKSDDVSTPGEDNEGNFMVNQTTLYPGSIMSVFPGQTLEVNFAIEGPFLNFSVSGPLSIIKQLDASATIKVQDKGDGKIIALYGSSQVPWCLVNMSSQELDGKSSAKGDVVVNGTTYRLSIIKNGVVTLNVSRGSTLLVSYSPEYGYMFSYWVVSGGLLCSDSRSKDIVVRVEGNGTLIAIYEPSRNQSWQKIHINPHHEPGPDKNFTLVLTPREGQLAPTLNPDKPSRFGNSEESTPQDLMLGDVVKIILKAKANPNDISLKVSLGYYDDKGAFHLIGSSTTTIKDEGYEVYELNIVPPDSSKVIPKGSKLVLILERVDQGKEKGTIHIWCGEESSRIELW